MRGLRAYGGHSVSFSWDEASVTGAVTAGCEGEILLRCFGAERRIVARAGERVEFAFERR